jgi:hypothetical protein
MPGVSPSHSIVDVEVGKRLKTYQQQRAYIYRVTASSHGALSTITRQVVGFIFSGRIFTSCSLVGFNYIGSCCSVI